MASVRSLLVVGFGSLALVASLTAASGATGAVRITTPPAIHFEPPHVVDPIHTFGEPDIGIDHGHVFVSGPTGTGTQRSVWYASADRADSFRYITPPPPPTALQGFEAPPGGGDTDIAFDRRGKQYFTDLYALVCLREATTPDGGATVHDSAYPGGCSGLPGADRQWLAVYDPAPGIPDRSPYTGPTPLVYQEYNNLATGAQWVKSNAAVDPLPGGPGLTYVNAERDGPGTATGYSPHGADGYPAIDQVTGKVFQAAGAQQPDGTYALLLNIGTPDASGDLRFLDHPTATHPSGDPSKLVSIARGLPDSPDTLFTVLSMDSARNLYVAWAVGGDGGSTLPAHRQVFVSAASASSGWRTWTRPVRVSDASTTTGDAVNIFPWIKAGGPGRADAVWYGEDKNVDPSAQAGQAWNVFLAQVVFPTGTGGAITGAAPGVQLVKVTRHPMHYNDACLLGSGCITTQGNRNLADFFEVAIDRLGAAHIVYDDTSNGLAQPGFTPNNQQLVDHAGAPVATVAIQSSGLGLYGKTVTGQSDAPRSGEREPKTGNALYPVIGGTNVPGMDLISDHVSLSGQTLTIQVRVADLSDPAATIARIPGAAFLQYVARWQWGNTIFYAGMENTAANAPTFFAGKAQSVDLCSVSACFPHVITYPEAGFPGGHAETGSVSCPATPSATNPCTITIRVHAADVGNVTSTSLLRELGAYAFASSHLEGTTTNAQALADNVPLEVDGLCCFNFQGGA